MCGDVDVSEASCVVTTFNLVVNSPTCLHSESFSSLTCLHSKSFSWNNFLMRESMYCSVGVVGLLAAKLVGALNSLDELMVGWTWLCVVYAGGIAGGVCVVVCVDVCGSGVVHAWQVSTSDIPFIKIELVPLLP